MPDTAIRWRAKGGIREVTIDGETMYECTVNLPLTIQIPLKAFSPPEVEVVTLHAFNKAAKIWEDNYKGKELKFKKLEVEVKATVLSVMDKILKRVRDGDRKSWAITEVVKSGSGTWSKGTTIPYASKKAQGELASFGWTSARGTDMPPVWITVHKIK